MKICRVIIILTDLFFFAGPSSGQSVDMFSPPLTPFSFKASATDEKIIIDGRLTEFLWVNTPDIGPFVQNNPKQDVAPTFPTVVKIGYNPKYLYIAAVCYQPTLNKGDIRVQNLHRDFDINENDFFSVAIDGFLDKRNAQVFQVHPLGSQRDLQSIDGNTFNTDWNTLWLVHTLLTDTSWNIEMAIPWKSLRYKVNSDKIGISFLRSIRKLNEYSALPAVPRSSTFYQMAYEAVIEDIHPPAPAVSLLINPYILQEWKQRKQSVSANNFNHSKAGGEIKWAIKPGTVLDATVNTDFGQAEVDKQVINLQRFSILFPERRQFFLENANLFQPNITSFIQPFFSRRIGLDENGNSIPIDGGIRLNSSGKRSNLGGLLMHQRQTGNNPSTLFAVGRYSKNIAALSRIGTMLTYRNDAAYVKNGSAVPSALNFTATIDGLYRPTQQFFIAGMLSHSYDKQKGNGIAAQAQASYRDNSYMLRLTSYYVKDYLPGVGFEQFGKNYFFINPEILTDWRPQWLPKKVRSFSPAILLEHYASTNLQNYYFGKAKVTPVNILFQHGAQLTYNVSWNYQNITESFSPLGVLLDKKQYHYLRQAVSFSSDFSKNLAAFASFGWGGYFNGNMITGEFNGRISIGPRLEIAPEYRLNIANRLGPLQVTAITHLVGINTLLCVNPSVQLSSLFQYNSLAKRSSLNIRFSWEYRPLSFIYLVFNSNHIEDPVSAAVTADRQVIAKLTYLRQF